MIAQGSKIVRSSENVQKWAKLVGVMLLAAAAWMAWNAQKLRGGEQKGPSFEDYATIEAYTNGVPVYSLGNITYIYGVSPEELPNVTMQDGDTHPVEKIKPKKSWEIKDNLYGNTMTEPGPRTAWDDSQPMLPIHLIDGDPNTAWCSYGCTVPDARPEWIRIDLPAESTVSAVVLECSQNFAQEKLWEEGKLRCHAEGDEFHKWAGRALPNELTIQVSRDAWHWETVYENKGFSGNEWGPSIIEVMPTPQNSNGQKIITGFLHPQDAGFLGPDDRGPGNPLQPNNLSASTVTNTGFLFGTANRVSAPPGSTVVEFAPHRAKQILITGNNFKRKLNKYVGYAFSLGEVEVRDPAGNNLALLSRGSGVTVSSTGYLYSPDRYSADVLFEPFQYDLGVKWSRLGVDNGMYCWYAVERQKGKLEVDPKSDQAITDMARNGIKVVMDLDVKGNYVYENRKLDWKQARFRELNNIYLDHPGWAWETPEMWQGYLRYVDYIVRHFKGRVAYYEAGNEWSGPDYIYPTVVRAIKKADPEAKIMVCVARAPQFKGVLEKLIKEHTKQEMAELMPDAVGFHPSTIGDAGMTLDDLHNFYWQENREAIKDCNALGFKGLYGATEIYSWASYPPGPRELNKALPMVASYYGDSEMVRAKYVAQMFVGHAGLNMLAFYCTPYWISAQVGQSLMRCPVPEQIVCPIQPDPAYYAIRTLSTVMADWKGAAFPVNFSGEKTFETFTLRRGEDEWMVAAWIPGHTVDGIVEAKTDITFPGLQAQQAKVIDVLNGTEQTLNLSAAGNDTVVRGIRIKDYPTLVQLKK